MLSSVIQRSSTREQKQEHNPSRQSPDPQIQKSLFILDVEVLLKWSVFSLVGSGEAFLWLRYRVATVTELMFCVMRSDGVKSRVSQKKKKKFMLFTLSSYQYHFCIPVPPLYYLNCFLLRLNGKQMETFVSSWADLFSRHIFPKANDLSCCSHPFYYGPYTVALYNKVSFDNIV